ncbi:unnamed protein product [Heterosigma akashiwo]
MSEMMATSEYEYDLIVIGGGSGGMAASKEAAKLGAKVALFDFVKPSSQGTKWGLGGTCVNVGCVPKKLMHYTALMGASFHDAKHFGWSTEHPRHNWEEMVDSVQNHVKMLNFRYRVGLKSNRVKYFNALATFSGPHEVTFIVKGKEYKATAQRFLIAVGGRPVIPDVPGAREVGITSDDVFSMKAAREDAGGGRLVHRAGVRGLPDGAGVPRDGGRALRPPPGLRPAVRREDRREHGGDGHPVLQAVRALGLRAPRQRQDPGAARRASRARGGADRAVRHRALRHRPARRHRRPHARRGGRGERQVPVPGRARDHQRGPHPRGGGRAARAAGADARGGARGHPAGQAAVRRLRPADGLRPGGHHRVHALRVRLLRAQRGGGRRAARGGEHRDVPVRVQLAGAAGRPPHHHAVHGRGPGGRGGRGPARRVPEQAGLPQDRGRAGPGLPFCGAERGGDDPGFRADPQAGGQEGRLRRDGGHPPHRRGVLRHPGDHPGQRPGLAGRGRLRRRRLRLRRGPLPKTERGGAEEEEDRGLCSWRMPPPTKYQ